ncbi:MAG: cation transporter [Chloroflexota bacterium]|nr:cation transporter [Chloroflexota bacterium]
MSNTLEQATLITPDISCAHCVATINKAVGGLQGVRRVEPDETTKQVLVEFDPTQVSLNDIEATLDDAGYPVQK